MEHNQVEVCDVTKQQLRDVFDKTVHEDLQAKRNNAEYTEADIKRTDLRGYKGLYVNTAARYQSLRCGA